MIIIKETYYKDVKAIKISNDLIEAIILPSEGAKIAYIKNKDGFKYLYQNPGINYKRMGLYDDFAAKECSGFDDMFPTIDEDYISIGATKGKKYIDHGEVSRLSFDYKIDNDKIILNADSKLYNYSYQKTITIKENRLIIDYEITNNNDDRLYCLWAMHCLLNSSNNSYIKTNNTSPFYLMFDGINELGNKGDFIDNKGIVKIHSDIDKKNCYKLYYKNEVGCIDYYYDNNNTISFIFDSNILKETGLWINNGLFNNFYCVGIEPATVGYDSLSNAKKFNQESFIEGNNTLSFKIEIEINNF